MCFILKIGVFGEKIENIYWKLAPTSTVSEKLDSHSRLEMRPAFETLESITCYQNLVTFLEHVIPRAREDLEKGLH